MKYHYIKYEKSTGVILSVNFRSDAEPEETEGHGILPVDNPLPYDSGAVKYVDLQAGAIIDRPAMPVSVNKTSIAADGIDEVVLTGLPTVEPNGTPVSVSVKVDGIEYLVDDGEFAMSVDIPGQYQIVCRAANYLEYQVTVEAA